MVGRSLAMWHFGVFPGDWVAPYTMAGVAHSVLGASSAPLVKCGVRLCLLRQWSSCLHTRVVDLDVVVLPLKLFGYGGDHIHHGICLAVGSLAPFVPWVVGGLIRIGIPDARDHEQQCEPRSAAWPSCCFWTNRAYLVAPMVGALIAAWARQMIRAAERVLTHRLCGTVGHPY